MLLPEIRIPAGTIQLSASTGKEKQFVCLPELFQVRVGVSHRKHAHFTDTLL